MSSFLYRVGRFAARRRWTVIVLWIAVVVGASTLAGVLGNHLQSSFTVPGTQAQSALDALEQRFPQISGASAKVVVAAPSGEQISTSENLIVTACEDIAALDDVVAVIERLRREFVTAMFLLGAVTFDDLFDNDRLLSA